VIFITIGSAFPFDRLIRAMDTWAAASARGDECLAQIGQGSYRPAHMDWRTSLPEADFAETVKNSALVVSHAGMGSVITAMRHGIPIVMLPRRFEAGEHTTDHQMATARWLEDKPGVFIAWDEAELGQRVTEAEGWTGDGAAVGPFAPQDFTDRLGAQLEEWTGR
jgi:UDP-N-acetylglucosamine transferase subunit ALG13